MLKLASADRTNVADSSSDFYLELLQPVRRGEKYALHSVLIPTSFYNVSTLNNVIPLLDGGGQSTATITPGFYSSSSLPAAVGTALTAASGFQTYTATVSNTTQLMTISAAGAFTLQFSLSTGTNAAGLLGFATGANTSSATSQTGSNVVNVSPVLAFHISIENIVSVPAATPSGGSATFVVPISVNSNSFMLYEPSQCDGALQVMVVDQDKKRLRIRVLNEQNQSLSLNGVQWFMLLRKL